MAKTVIGLYDDINEAQRVADDLRANDFGSNEIMVARQNDVSRATDKLNAARIPDRDVRFYTEGINRGGALVLVETSDDRARRASEIMSQYNIVDVDTRLDQYRQGGMSDMSVSTLDEEGGVIEVVEEELQVGKRQVQRGGVRIHTHVSERPVEEQVTLRDEAVRVERRPVDRPAGDADMSAFKEGTLEVTETDEEAVVSKQARVIEEVVIEKDVDDRTETVRDTVRRTNVDVEQIDNERTVGRSDYDDYDADYRSYYDTNLANSGYTYEQYQPIFRYGHGLATSKRYRGKDWADVEPEARRDWEERNPGTWEQFKDSVRHAWDRARR